VWIHLDRWTEDPLPTPSDPLPKRKQQYRRTGKRYSPDQPGGRPVVSSGMREVMRAVKERRIR
jgi:hypothetical protein